MINKDKTFIRFLKEAIGYVGIFWVDERGEILGDGDSWRLQDIYTRPNDIDPHFIDPQNGWGSGYDRVDFEKNHEIEWRKYKNSRTEFKGKSWNEVPRGRVVYDKGDRTFRILTGPNVIKNKNIQRNIIDFFNLSKNKYEFVPDYEHYSL